LLGNDVIDLDDPDTRQAHRHPRARARVCTDAERAALECAADPRELYWSLFAAKEAAYKALVKLGEQPGLGYRRLEVSLELDRVSFGAHRLGLRVVRGAGWVHALAAPVDARVASVVERADAGSDAARAALIRLASRLLGVPPAELEVEREPLEASWDGFAPPRLLRRGVALPVNVSLAHQGRFVAAAVL
jgi:hypothetical protein